jgi:hypothetical protein
MICMGKSGDLFTVHRRSLARAEAARTCFSSWATPNGSLFLQDRTERIGQTRLQSIHTPTAAADCRLTAAAKTGDQVRP